MRAKTLCHCPIDFIFLAILSEAEVWWMRLSEAAADLRSLFWFWATQSGIIYKRLIFKH